jgi:hypothetical protein
MITISDYLHTNNRSTFIYNTSLMTKTPLIIVTKSEMKYEWSFNCQLLIARCSYHFRPGLLLQT